MPEPVPTQLLQLSVCAVDLDRGVVLRDNETTALTSKEFGLLVLLSGHPGVTFSRDALLREVWQQDSPGLTRAVDIAMRRLRQKVEANASRPEHLLTVRGEGYRYQGQPRIQLTAPARLAPTQLTNLGAASDLFIGRGADLDALEQSLSSTKRLLTLIGPPGVGKTRLARQFGRRVLANYPGGVWFCDLTSATSLASVYMALAHGLTLSLTRSGASPASQIGADLATRGRTLVLLDNAEQVAEEVAETLTEWIQRAPEVQWVVTSRVRLQLRAEHLVPVEPLEVSTGAALFANRAQMANRSFQLNRSNRAQVESFVALLDNMPLAIELAAARVNVLTLEQLHDRLSDHLRLLGMRRRDVRSIKATLHGSLEWSWKLLTPWEQAALAQCSAFRGGFDLEAAESIIELSEFEGAPWAMDAVQVLVDHSLIRVYEPEGEPGEVRFGLYASILAFAESKLSHLPSHPSTGPHPVYQRHASWYSTFGEQRWAEQGATAEGARALRREQENVRFAMERSLTHGWWSEACLTGFATLQELLHSGPYEPGIAIAQRVLSALPNHSQDYARLLAKQGELERRTGQLDEALTHYKEALHLAQLLADRATQGAVQGQLGHHYRETGQLDLARAHYHEALAIHQELNNRRLEGTFQGNIALLYRQQGDTEAAERHTLQALAIHRETGNRRSEGIVLGNLGSIQYLTGRRQEALQTYHAAIAIHRETGNRRTQAIVLGNLGTLLQGWGHLQEAEARFGQALAIVQELGDRRLQSYAKGYLGSLCLEQGHLSDAQHHFEQVLTEARDDSDLRSQANALGYLGRLCLHEGQLEEAGEHLANSLRIHQQLKQLRQEALIESLIGQLADQQQRFDDGLDMHTQALTHIQAFGDPLTEGMVHGALGAHYGQTGSFDLANEHLAQGERLLRDTRAPFELARLLCQTGEVALLMNDVKAARQALAEVEQIAKVLKTGTESEVGRALHHLENQLR